MDLGFSSSIQKRGEQKVFGLFEDKALRRTKCQVGGGDFFE